MRRAVLFLASGLLVSAADTVDLARLLNPFHAQPSYELSAGEYAIIQTRYFAWIDGKLKAGVSLKAMNRELKSAGLFSDESVVAHDFARSLAGFLVPIAPLPGAHDLLVIKAGVYTGAWCNFDETILLYRRQPLERLATINSTSPYWHGYRLDDIAIGRDDPAGGTIVASAWIASNCTSVWNGTGIRIDLLGGRRLQSVLDRGIQARNDEGVSIDVRGGVVTFRYETTLRDINDIGREGLARYRVLDGRAVRLAPIASSFGGFIDEWLRMDDAEAARWSAPEAAARHHELAAAFGNELIKWSRVAQCPGPPPAREIVVRGSGSKRAVAFRIGGSAAAEMRLLSVADQPSPACREIGIGRGFERIIREPH